MTADRVIDRSGGDLRPTPKPKKKPKKKNYPKPPGVAELKAANPDLKTLSQATPAQDDAKIRESMITAARETAREPTLTLDGLERAEESLTEDSKKMLDFLLTDVMNDDIDRDPDVTKSIRRACYRAQMRDGSGDELTFFRHLNDPGFMKIVKDSGAALVGSHILPLVATLLNIAIEDRKQWAMIACLKITGLLPTQYDIYQLKYQNTHINNYSGEVNYGGKSDAELENIWSSIHDESEAETVDVEDRTG